MSVVLPGAAAPGTAVARPGCPKAFELAASKATNASKLGKRSMCGGRGISGSAKGGMIKVGAPPQVQWQCHKHKTYPSGRGIATSGPPPSGNHPLCAGMREGSTKIAASNQAALL